MILRHEIKIITEGIISRFVNCIKLTQGTVQRLDFLNTAVKIRLI